jgi:hypothetical protein
VICQINRLNDILSVAIGTDLLGPALGHGCTATRKKESPILVLLGVSPSMMQVRGWNGNADLNIGS